MVFSKVNRRVERGYALEPLTIQVRTWEPNQRAPDGTNPTDQIHTLVFPALPMTSEFVQSRGINQTLRITVTTTQDTLQETSDVIKAELLPMTELFVDVNQTETFTVTTTDDGVRPPTSWKPRSLRASTASTTPGTRRG